MKIILCTFEQLSGLKINFYKSELFCYREAKEHMEQYSQIVGCGVGTKNSIIKTERWLKITLKNN
jgi:hypothetical protein